MKITKWVDIRAEVEVEIGAEDIRVVLSEEFANVAGVRLGEEEPNKPDILKAFNSIGTFLRALTDAQIGMLKLHAANDN